MLSYPEDNKLEKLLEELFSNDDELGGDDITILNNGIDPIFSPFGNCCKISYTGYDG